MLVMLVEFSLFFATSGIGKKKEEKKKSHLIYFSRVLKLYIKPKVIV